MTPNDSMRLMLATFQYRPWAIYKPAIAAVAEQMRIRSEAVARMSADAIDAAVLALADRPLGRMVGSVAVIPVTGCITQKSDFYSWWYGGTSVERMSASFRTYLNDPNVSAIVFDVDSPGGEVYGLQEFAEEMLAARGQKKMIAVCDPFMASAAYWIGCSCDEVAMMPSGQCGSVGAYTMHFDMSAMLAELGVKVTIIKHGEHKAEGTEYEPLSEDAQAEFQACIDYYGGIFDKHVARARGKSVADVRATFGQGRVLRSPDAKKVGMVDKVATLDQVLSKLAPKRTIAMAAGVVDELHVHADASVSDALAVKSSAAIDPNDDGTCPDGYELRDGMCHMTTEDAQAAATRQKADKDLVLIAMAATA